LKRGTHILWKLWSRQQKSEQSPVFIGFGCMMLDRAWLDQSGVEILGCIGLKVARRTRVPVALLLNETQTFEQAVRGLRAGFNMVMMDTSGMPSDGKRQERG
jgi:fructose/tagatose bisphosphate aldolase